MMEAQWWECTNDEYHGETAIIGRSMLETFRQSPSDYHARYVAKSKTTETTEALLIGSLVHWLVLDHGIDIGLADSPFAIEPKCDRRTTAGKAEAAEWAESAKGKTIITAKNWELSVNCASAILKSRYRNLFLGDGDNERAIKWIDEQTGLECKCKIDRIRENCLPDIKTTNDVRPEAFSKSIENFGYHRQAEWYERGFELIAGEYRPLTFVVVSKETFDVACYDIDGSDLSAARDENDEALCGIADCFRSGEWTAPWQRQVITLSRPTWARKREYRYDHSNG